MHFVYILYSHSRDIFYFGETAEPARRFAQHNRGNVDSTKSGLPWIVVWADSKPNREMALTLEKKLKNLRSKKRVYDFINKYPVSENLIALFESTDDSR